MLTNISYQLDDEEIPQEIADKIDGHVERMEELLEGVLEENKFLEEKYDGGDEFIFTDVLNGLMKKRDKMNEEIEKLNSYIQVLVGYLDILRRKEEIEDRVEQEMMSGGQQEQESGQALFDHLSEEDIEDLMNEEEE